MVLYDGQIHSYFFYIHVYIIGTEWEFGAHFTSGFRPGLSLDQVQIRV